MQYRAVLLSSFCSLTLWFTDLKVRRRCVRVTVRVCLSVSECESERASPRRRVCVFCVAVAVLFIRRVSRKLCGGSRRVCCSLFGGAKLSGPGDSFQRWRRSWREKEPCFPQECLLFWDGRGMLEIKSRQRPESQPCLVFKPTGFSSSRNVTQTQTH